MKKSTIIIGVMLLVCFAVTALGQTADKAQVPQTKKNSTETDKKVEKKAEPTLIGEWTLNPNKYRKGGSITFKEDGTYSKTEWDIEGGGATIMGEYKIDLSKEPFAIDLCLNKCGGPGSEWTTQMGIFKFQKDGTVQIRTSPDKKYPTVFAEEPDMYTMILTRVEKKE